jgi:hypothetical protein
MQSLLRNKIFITTLLIAIAIGGYSFIFTEQIDFNTDVKPIFNKKCISCHGGVKKKGGFSLLFPQEALAATESGKPAIVPGDPDASEMIKRLTHHDPEERMPYKEAPLSDEEIETLTKWVRQGAKWGDHWAYVPVANEAVPKLKRRFLGILPSPYADWVKNDVDHFILDKLKDKGLEPSREADKATLLRRAALDIIGMPAPAAIGEKFLKDDSPEAYEKLVDTLLSLPYYGEKWTALWLDLSRYADTKGYERDEKRQIWRYRDWLIKAFNDDKPYNVFLTEQIAGDLLPDATDEQLIATAFHRNTMTNDEGGTDNEEFRTAAVLDRVNTTWEVLLGTSFACVQCHSHPYDPFRHEEYYKFMAFFNNSRDEDTYSEYPLLWEFKNEDAKKYTEVSDWFRQNVSKTEADVVINFLRTRQPTINSLVSDSMINAALLDTKWLGMRNFSHARFRNVELSGRTKMLMRMQSWATDGQLTIRLDDPAGPILTSFRAPQTKNGWTLHQVDINPTQGKHDLYFQYNSATLKKDNNGMMFDWLCFTNELPGKGKPGFDSAYAGYYHLLSKGDATTTPIMVENPVFMLRKTFVFERGNWTAKTTEVQPGVPGSLHPLPQGAPANRLGLAMWLTDKKNPLTSRAMVNRVWEQLFGTGLVETLEDLGTQGIPPTHPELLNYLSYQFMNDQRWSLKKLIREIVLSATYKQDSKVSPEGLEKDRFNRYYARGPRVRLSAEQLRDQALAVSGTFYPQMYGPSTKPWQPEGIWNSPYSGGEKWENNYGPERYRRAVYTYWKRTSAYPSMLNFDAMQREVCTSRRIRTNTPLQALTLLNDHAYVDISRQFTYGLQKEFKDVNASISAAYQRATGREISKDKLATLASLYQEALQGFRKDPVATCEMNGLQDEHNNPETAALIVVVHSIMNLDEVITKT